MADPIPSACPWRSVSASRPIARLGRVGCAAVILAGLVVAPSVVAPFVPVALAQPAATPREGALEPLAVTTASGPHPFSVEVMRTDAERERGLMFRRYLPPDRGMLFDFKTEQPVLMWMKNTYIPLDMIFMNRSGAVVSIARDAEPLSERIIPSGAPAYAVLEVNAGTADKIGLKVGDIVRNKLFRN